MAVSFPSLALLWCRNPCQIILFKSAPIKALSKTPSASANSMLEIAESYCFFMNILPLIIFSLLTQFRIPQVGSEWTRFQHWLKRQSFHSWMIWLSRTSQHSDWWVLWCFSPPLPLTQPALNYTPMRDWGKGGERGCGWNRMIITKESWLVKHANC